MRGDHRLPHRRQRGDRGRDPGAGPHQTPVAAPGGGTGKGPAGEESASGRETAQERLQAAFVPGEGLRRHER